jgi:membrane protein DedA with SNARE-associated domain
MHAMVPDFFVIYTRSLTLKPGTVMLLLQKYPSQVFLPLSGYLLANNSFFYLWLILLASMTACILR